MRREPRRSGLGAGRASRMAARLGVRHGGRRRVGRVRFRRRRFRSSKILDEIKTERAQAAVDHRRALSTFADAISGEVFDRAKAEAGAKMRLDSADRLRAAVVTALGRLHELLDPSQRARLAYLIRTGTLSI
ncbi:MAG: hypothetical protein DMF55_01835 [Acidobacteria bacterium]|nr:MAG: hypothetical protein DMF55_01835 [Acidobacteriota bacterium]